MSAITGSGDSRTIRGSASASSSFGTATRTISQPADASAAICAVVASTSCVFVSVIDWTTTGAPPPIATPPTVIWRSLDIPRISLPRRVGASARASADAELAPQCGELPVESAITHMSRISAKPTMETRS